MMIFATRLMWSVTTGFMGTMQSRHLMSMCEASPQSGYFDIQRQMGWRALMESPLLPDTR
jgi:hypothetical protein